MHLEHVYRAEDVRGRRNPVDLRLATIKVVL